MNAEFARPPRVTPRRAPKGRGPKDGQPGECAEYLLEILEADKGIVGVDFDTASQHLAVRYDASVLPAHRAASIAEEISERLATHQGMCILRNSAGGCESCAATLKQGLWERGQLQVTVTVGAGKLALKSGLVVQAAETVRPAVASRQDRRVPGREPFWQRWEQNHWQIALTATTGASLVLAWLTGLLGVRPSIPLALHIVAYLTGG